MLIADDQRRWVTENAAASELLGLTREEVAWRTMDDFTPPSERGLLDERWQEFLTAGAAEGWYELRVPRRGAVSVEFSATANVMPARHLTVFMVETESAGSGATDDRPPKQVWTPVPARTSGHAELTKREREVVTLVASGLHGSEIAERLFLSQETVKSHVQNAMDKLDVHTRAHAVAIALVTGQIAWEGAGIDDSADAPPTSS